ncbi:MAG: hypothetical protein NT167_31105, partial [Verrucomicrobia bacterium]|nr:hypothetical protein [Verrucomicrobiota bacterium]
KGDRQYLLLPGKCDPSGPPQRNPGQIKRPAHLGQQPLFQKGLFLARRHSLQVYFLPGQRNLFGGGNLLQQVFPLLH